MFYHKFLVLGGDLRNLSLARHLVNDGKKVLLYGFSNYNHTEISETFAVSNLSEAIAQSEVIIGPVPCCVTDELLNAPFNDVTVSIEKIFAQIKDNQIFTAGFIGENILKIAESYGIEIYDFLKRDEMAILNAIPTAEGAIQIAFEEMNITLHSSNALVLGYGRVSKILCKMLAGIGAKVFVVTRRFDDEASIKSFGYIPIFYEELPEYLGDMDVIFNTVPSPVLDKTNLRYVCKECILIELASKPFGIDYEASRKENLKVMWASSLPSEVNKNTKVFIM